MNRLHGINDTGHHQQSALIHHGSMGEPTHEGTDLSSWVANLELTFTAHEGKTILARKAHVGPLRVQKALYPEGETVCHVIVLHPPGGVVGGDILRMNINVKDAAHALLTTPGATKWYRSLGAQAEQSVQINVAKGAKLEWLLQESIFFTGAKAKITTQVHLAEGAQFLGLDVFCLGRKASGEEFSQGELMGASNIYREGRLIWHEQSLIEGGSPLIHSPIGMAGFSVCATALATFQSASAELIAQCRGIVPRETEARSAVTALPSLLVLRYLGHSADSARDWFFRLWQCIRPQQIGTPAIMPRIWLT